LDNLGITLKLTEAYDIYAAQLGKSVDDLTSAEKQQAFLNAAMEKGVAVAERLGGVNDDGAASVERLTATWSDLRGQLGEIMIPILETVANKLTEWMEAFQGLDVQTKKTLLTIAGIAAIAGPAALGIGKLAAAWVWLAATPWGLIAIGIGAVVASLAYFEATGGIAGAYDSIQDLAQGFRDFVFGGEEVIVITDKIRDRMAGTLVDAVTSVKDALKDANIGLGNTTASWLKVEQASEDAIAALEGGARYDFVLEAFKGTVDGILSEYGIVVDESTSIYHQIIATAIDSWSRATGVIAGSVEPIKQVNAALDGTAEVAALAAAAIEAIISRQQLLMKIDALFAKQAGAGWVGLHDRAQATFDLFTKELPEAEELLLTMPEAIGDWTEAQHELGDVALNTVDTAIGAYSQMASSIQGIYQNMFDGIANMLAGNKAAEEAHSASLIEINQNKTDTLGQLAKDRTAALAAELVALNAGEISREEYAENIKEINKDYTQAVIDADTARTDSIQDADDALEEAQVSMGDILKEMAHDFVVSIRNQLLAIAAQETVLALVAAAMLNWVGAAQHGIAAAAALAAALGLVVTGFAEGGIVNGPTLGLLGEAGVSEAAIPLTKENLAGIGAGIANVMGSQPQQLAAVGGVTINFYDTTVRSDDDIREIVYGVQGVYEESERSSGVVRVVK